MIKSYQQTTETHLMMMNPPGAGDDLGVPCGAVTHCHGAGFRQGSRGDGVPCSTTAERQRWVKGHRVLLKGLSRSERAKRPPDGFLMTQLVAPWRSACTYTSPGRGRAHAFSLALRRERSERADGWTHYQLGGSAWQSSRSAAGPFLQWLDNSLSWWTTGTSQTWWKSQDQNILKYRHFATKTWEKKKVSYVRVCFPAGKPYQ